jgi:hypothetical protein
MNQIHAMRKAKEAAVSADFVRSILSYDPETGEFVWRVRRGKTCRAGDAAGAIKRDGYRHISIGRVKFLAHRIAWLYMTGSFPEYPLDHINRDKLDNRWANLRETNHSDNAMNCGLRSDNTSGFRGVSRYKNGPWVAQIFVRGRPVFLGRFDTAERAAAAYEAARAFHFPAVGQSHNLAPLSPAA